MATDYTLRETRRRLEKNFITANLSANIVPVKLSGRKQNADKEYIEDDRSEYATSSFISALGLMDYRSASDLIAARESLRISSLQERANKKIERRGRPKKATESAESDASHDDACYICQRGGEVLLCDHCDHVYHLRCLSPPLLKVPDGEWLCPECHKGDVFGGNADVKKEVVVAGGFYSSPLSLQQLPYFSNLEKELHNHLDEKSAEHEQLTDQKRKLYITVGQLTTELSTLRSLKADNVRKIEANQLQLAESQLVMDKIHLEVTSLNQRIFCTLQTRQSKINF